MSTKQDNSNSNDTETTQETEKLQPENNNAFMQTQKIIIVPGVKLKRKSTAPTLITTTRTTATTTTTTTATTATTTTTTATTIPPTTGPSDDGISMGTPEVDESIQAEWIKQNLFKRESEWVNLFTNQILCATWNVNNKKPEGSLHNWLIPQKPNNSSTSNTANSIANTSNTNDITNDTDKTPLNSIITGTSLPALVAIGLQEMDMSAEGLLLQQISSRSDPWDKAFLDTLNSNSSQRELYQKVASLQLCGIFLCVYCRFDIKPHIKNVQTTSVTTGIMGILGNKGGVVVRLELFDSSICFVNSHFNAHQTNVERRNQDFQDIYRSATFTLPSNTNSSDIDSFGIADHDMMFWLGDLNYRIDLPDQFVKDKIQSNDWDTLYEADQLHQQQMKGNVFKNWKEGNLLFAPTYKYDTNSQDYDTSEKQRVPAWTDRVLWRTREAGTSNHNDHDDNIVQLLSYERHELLASDHRPVSARFAVKIKVVNETARVRVLNEVIRTLDSINNSERPEAHLDCSNVQFGKVYYDKPCIKSITVLNKGRYPFQWKFKPKLNSPQGVCKKYISISPTKGILYPQSSTDITLTCTINADTAPKICALDEKISDILVLHLHRGPDYFINIDGKYQQSSFGNSLQNLCRFVLPVRTASLSGFGTLKVPKELWRIIDWLYNNALDEEDLFLEAGTSRVKDTIRNCLDTGAEFPSTVKSEIDVYSMAEILLSFLESLSDSVVPSSCFLEVLLCSKSFSECKKIVDKFGEIHYNCFYYIISFLREVLTHSALNKLNAEKLAFIFASVMIRQKVGKGLDHSTQLRMNSEAVEQSKIKFIHNFLK